MSEIQDAATKAVAFVREIYGEDAVQDPRIEEVERDGRDWRITLSWSTPQVVLGINVPSRTYKQFVVDAGGNVKSMHIRKVE